MTEVSPQGLVAALARAQAKFPKIRKAHTNPHFKSKYADLSDVLAAVVPVLAGEGIALSQPMETDDEGNVRLLTVLEGYGEVRQSAIPLHLDGMTPQQLGSTLTYFRRYQLAAMLAVAADDDDDGNAAQDGPAMSTGRGKPPSDKSAVYMGKLRHEVCPQEGVWQRFATAVLGESPPDVLSGPQVSKLIDALLAAKKNDVWPDGMYPEGEEPF